MQGVLIVSADLAVRKSLAAILQSGRTVTEAAALSECLARAAAEKFDFVFIDGVFEDGSAEELAAGLHALGYGPEIIPVLLSQEELYEQPFRQYGVRCSISKPFNVHQVNRAVELIEEIVRLSDSVISHARESLGGEGPETATPTPASTPLSPAGSEIDVREVSQRFRRLLARLQSREELVRAFADSLQEQFDIDNVVVLLPASRRPVFDIACGDLPDEVRAQFFLPFNEPLVKHLIRLGEPVWVHDCDRLGRANACLAIRSGERLNVQILCPVLSRGRLKAIVGLSRLHRYSGNPAVLSLLRLFMTFFAEALENSDLYGRVAASGDVHRAMFEVMDSGMIAVSEDGMIIYANPVALDLLASSLDELLEQPVEKAGSVPAHHVRTAIEEGQRTEEETISSRSGALVVSAAPLTGVGGAVLRLRLRESAAAAEDPARPEPAGAMASWPAELDRVWKETAAAIAHNFKNAFVPVQTCAELLPSRYQDAQFREFFLTTVADNIDRINHWIEQLLVYSRVGDNDERSSFSLREVIEAGIEIAESHYASRQVGFKFEYGLNDTVTGRRAVLERVFAEITRNALDAVQDVADPEVIVGTEITADGVTAFIEDNGEGIPADFDADEILRPFVSSKLSGSLGLGLAYADLAIKDHGGKLRFAPGRERGTRVMIMLPQVKAVQKSPVDTVKNQ